MPLTPEQRVLRARIAANTLHAMRDPKETVAKATAASPASIDYWLRQVDPDDKLTEADRTARAERLRRAHFQRLALKSAQARSRGGDAA